jgi:peptide/nickel transport system ATP-binding protein
MRVGRIIARNAECLRGMDRRDAATLVERLLELVRLPRSVVRERTSSLSGGEMQRVAIARALAAEPSVLLCDEITSALDVSVQAAIVELVREVQQQVGCAVIFVTHDLGLVASVASRVAVMDAGGIVELRSATEVFEDPREPTTRALVRVGTSIRSSSREPSGSDGREYAHPDAQDR